MSRSYPECDSYTCEVCPRRGTCDMREPEPAAAPDPAVLLLDSWAHRLDEMQRQIDALTHTIDAMFAALVKIAQGDEP